MDDKIKFVSNFFDRSDKEIDDLYTSLFFELNRGVYPIDVIDHIIASLLKIKKSNLRKYYTLIYNNGSTLGIIAYDTIFLNIDNFSATSDMFKSGSFYITNRKDMNLFLRYIKLIVDSNIQPTKLSNMFKFASNLFVPTEDNKEQFYLMFRNYVLASIYDCRSFKYYLGDFFIEQFSKLTSLPAKNFSYNIDDYPERIILNYDKYSQSINFNDDVFSFDFFYDKLCSFKKGYIKEEDIDIKLPEDLHVCYITSDVTNIRYKFTTKNVDTKNNVFVITVPKQKDLKNVIIERYDAYGQLMEKVLGYADDIIKADFEICRDKF